MRRNKEKAGTDITAAAPLPDLFTPHPHFSDEVNRNIAQSEIEGGVWLDDLAEGALLEVETQNRWYTIVIRGRGKELISGHPQYCPEPVPVRIAGSTWGGTMLKQRFIGRGMRLEFRHPVYRTIITSQIVDIRATDERAAPWCVAPARSSTVRGVHRPCMPSKGAASASSSVGR